MAQLVVVRVRGTVNTRYDVKKTLELLKLSRRYRATIVPSNDCYLGMLNLAKDHIAWGEIDFETAKLLFTKRGRTLEGKPVNESVAKLEGFESLDQMVSSVVDGVTKFNQFKKVKQYFCLSPPRGGFKRSTKKPFKAGGVLGENEQILSLISRMI
ncbi:MAG: 50S ribosomal protein L30 [Nitrososphaeria archaeon]